MSEKRQDPAPGRVERYAQGLIAHRWKVLLGSLLFAAACFFGARTIEFENSYRIFFSEENPQLQAFEALQNVYTKDDNILFVLTAPEDSIYEAKFMEAVRWLTEEAWQLPYSRRVDSITNFQNSVAVEDDIFVEDLAPEEKELDAARLAYMEQVALNEPLLYNRIINSDGYATGVTVTVSLPELDLNETPETAAAARDLERRFNERYPEIQTHLAGMVIMDNAFVESTVNDLKTIVMPMFFALFVVMAILLRSFWGTLATGLVLVLTLMTSFGLMGWVGINMSTPLGTMPIMIMTLAVADCVHILVTMLNEMRHGREKRSALVESVRINFAPVLLTSVTTAIGFLSMNFSDAPPFRDLGNVVAIGVMAACGFSIVTLPALVSVIPLRVKRFAEGETHLFDKWVELLQKHRGLFLAGSTAVVALMALMIPRIELNDQWTKYFDTSLDVRVDMDYAEENLTGMSNLEFSLPAGESGGISNPEYLRLLDEFSEWYRSNPDVLQVNSIADTMKRLNKNMHGDDPAFYRIPEERDLAAQYLLMYEFSLPYGLDLNNQINVDKSASRVTVTAADLRTKELRELIAQGEQWLEQNAPAYMHVKAASPTVMFAYISERNINSMLTGTILAFVSISLILMFALRSVKYGLVSIIPNVVPAILGIGTWSVLYGEMGMSVSVITGMTLGIVVDDTVHFLSKYIRARREKGLSGEAAVRSAFRTVGKALVVTTLILSVGFSILGLSSFRLNNWMGQLTAIVIVFALIADFVLLPAVLLSLDKKRARCARTKAVESREAEPALV
ncbi:MMPL family transporter [Pelagicoccus sp. SDUM812003]|uniref:efflux RND transporter permease subunit n=1 Tax=Pelagicoccus sp. SDUM812003 TaxID=3041267 RepID=UPI0028108CE6|nr:MMPL family transporter [Pelagicoccus sp. SDUM812003]MDQ8202430.1 MMPL family transporter [Pelagicoccus sp. SDUM812003]